MLRSVVFDVYGRYRLVVERIGDAWRVLQVVLHESARLGVTVRQLG